jgi:hypothetical protein
MPLLPPRLTASSKEPTTQHRGGSFPPGRWTSTGNRSPRVSRSTEPLCALRLHRAMASPLLLGFRQLAHVTQVERNARFLLDPEPDVAHVGRHVEGKSDS